MSHLQLIASLILALFVVVVVSFRWVDAIRDLFRFKGSINRTILFPALFGEFVALNIAALLIIFLGRF